LVDAHIDLSLASCANIKVFDRCDADDEYVLPVLRREVARTQADLVEDEDSMAIFVVGQLMLV